MAPAAAGVPAPSASIGARAFHAFIAESGPLCQRAAARACVEAGWRFADGNRDGRLSLDEAEAVRAGLRAWLTWPDNGIGPAQRASVRLGLMIVEAVGLPRLMESYDADGDGALDRRELLSDVHLDERPLGQVLRDPQAVDWGRIKIRLGALAPALGALGAPPAE